MSDVQEAEEEGTSFPTNALSITTKRVVENMIWY
jgi:hypothetical protein